MNYPTNTVDTDVKVAADGSRVAEQALRQARESLVLPNLALAASLARRQTGRWNVDEQFIEAALVGLMRAIDSFDPAASEAFEGYAEALILRELELLAQDCREDREDRILQRDQAAARAKKRIELALQAQPDFRMLAVSLGFPADDLASGFLSAVIRHPEILSSADAAE
jgi:RNA polymerase sigma-B factor